MSEQKKVIVSGVSGQDGSYMVDYLLANTPHLVYGMVRRTSKPDYTNLTEALKSPRFKLVTGDLTDSHSIDTLVRDIRPDYFINLAAQSFVGSSWKLPEQTDDVDADGVIRCLEAIQKHARHCRFYNAGSSEEFGEVESVPQSEEHPPRPQSPYGAAKCSARHYVRVYRKSYGLYAIQGYLFNHESERRGEEFVTRKITKGVARIAKAIKEGRPFEPIELGNLDAKRDWSHAEDFVDGIWKMLNQEEHRKDRLYRDDHNPPAPGWLKEYVLASDETHTVREFVEKAFTLAGIQGKWWANLKGDPQSEIYTFEDPVLHWPIPNMCLVRINPAFYRPAEVSLLHGNSRRARSELRWQPKVSFDQLVERMVKHDLKEVGL